MDYKKEYKNLVAKIKIAHLNAQTDSTKNVLEDILPSLRESEDERIRKAIVHLLEVASEAYLIEATGFKKEQFLSYLEKLKEQKPVEIDDIIRKARSEGRQEVIDNPGYYQLLKPEEMQKPVEWSKEDEVVIDCAVEVIEKAGLPSLAASLKSLRPSWKPSEEQLTALWSIKNLKIVKESGWYEPLNSLCEQLEKL